MLYLSDRNKRVPTRTKEQKNMVGIKVMREEQLVDPPFDYIKSDNKIKQIFCIFNFKGTFSE